VEVAVEGMPTVVYGHLTKEKVPELIQKHLMGKEVLKSSALAVGGDKQLRIVLRNCGVVDPESLRDYVSQDGYLGDR